MPNLTPSTTPSARGRRGFTLIELMVSLVMFGIVSGIIIGMVRSQQRFYRGATEVIDIRSQLRQAAAVLPLDLRSISTVSQVAPAGSPYQPSVLGSDITAMTDRTLQFRATIGSGVICQAAVGANLIAVAPLGVLAKGNVLTAWYTPPAINDTIFVFDAGSDAGAADDQWRPYRINAIVRLSTPLACGASPLLKTGNKPAGDDDREKWVFGLASAGAGSTTSPLPSSIGAGSVVRFTRSVIYSLYQVNNDWYLGYKTMQTNGGATLVAGDMQPNFDPIAGPYRRYSLGGATNGLQFVYYDSTGAVTAQRNAVARIDVTLRGEGVEKRNAANATSQRNNANFLDSLQLSVAIRNRA